MKKRKIEVVVISDVHLGTPKCHADELLNYLNSIQPKTLILNGDILDTWKKNEEYFPSSHIKVIRKILGMSTKGTKVYYIIGNHDQNLRKFNQKLTQSLQICNKLILNLNGKKAWFFHGDVFDIDLKTNKLFAKLGSTGYKLLLKINKCINWTFAKIGKKRFTLSKKFKKSIEKYTKDIANFEKTVSELAIDNSYSYVICGHTHVPKKQDFFTEKGSCTYLNSGDWVENLTALEYSFKRWKVYKYNHDKLIPFFADEELKNMNLQDLIDSLTSKENPEKKSPILKKAKA